MTPEELAQSLKRLGKHVTPDRRVRQEVAAEVIGCSVFTLRNWRENHEGPRYYRMKVVWYRLDDLLSWIESRATSSN